MIPVATAHRRSDSTSFAGLAGSSGRRRIRSCFSSSAYIRILPLPPATLIRRGAGIFELLAGRTLFLGFSSLRGLSILSRLSRSRVRMNEGSADDRCTDQTQADVSQVAVEHGSQTSADQRLDRTFHDGSHAVRVVGNGHAQATDPRHQRSRAPDRHDHPERRRGGESRDSEDAGIVIPRSVRRRRSRCLAFARRLWRVPSGRFRRPAASR